MTSLRTVYTTHRGRSVQSSGRCRACAGSVRRIGKAAIKQQLAELMQIPDYQEDADVGAGVEALLEGV